MKMCNYSNYSKEPKINIMTKEDLKYSGKGWYDIFPNNCPGPVSKGTNESDTEYEAGVD